jgi:hypothetical protein
MSYPSQGELQKRYHTAVEAKRRLALNHMAVQEQALRLPLYPSQLPADFCGFGSGYCR